MPHYYNFYAYAYLEYFRSNFIRRAWIFEYTECLIRSAPEGGFLFLLDILTLANTNEENFWIANGFFEELLHSNLELLGPKITCEARTNYRLRNIIQLLASKKLIALNKDYY
jgi:hypothetical protein